MLEILFRHSDTKLTNLAYDSGATGQMAFRTVRRPDAILDITVDGGAMLNGRKWENRLYSHKEIGDIVISADELDSTAFTFFESFWKAKYKYIGLWATSTWGNYIEVLTGGGLFPLSYVEDIRDLKEIALKLKYANPES